MTDRRIEIPSAFYTKLYYLQSVINIRCVHFNLGFHLCHHVTPVYLWQHIYIYDNTDTDFNDQWDVGSCEILMLSRCMCWMKTQRKGGPIIL